MAFKSQEYRHYPFDCLRVALVLDGLDGGEPLVFAAFSVFP